MHRCARGFFVGAASRALLWCLLALATCPAVAAGRGQVMWDSYGVPHIYAATEADAFYGFGWAQASSHADIVLKLYGQARGRAAEYWGKEYIEQDRWLVSNDVYPRARQWYAQQPPGFRKDLDAFARGITDYVRQHPDRVDASLQQVLPITGVDVVAHAHRLMNYVYITNPQKVMGEPPSDTRARDGSNAWALAPARTRDGATMLLANPHLPWAPGFYTYYEAQLNGPGFNIYGATQIGLPIIRFAFNPDLGFTNTVNTMLGATVYKLTPDGDGYLFDHVRHAFRIEHKTLQVRQDDGSLKPLDIEVRHAIQGPVFTRYDGTLVALRVAGLDRPGMLQQYWDMARARDFTQFQAALRRLQVPMFNIVYADRAGNILYLDNGILPRRAQGDAKFWSGLVPGDTSATLWEAKDILRYEELPKVVNPPGGFVQNTNDAPWLATWPRVLDAKDFPAYVVGDEPMSMRGQTSVLSLAGEEKLSFEQFEQRKSSVHSLAADRLVPPLVALARDSQDEDIRQGAATLAAWNHDFEREARGALLFEQWMRLFAGDRLSSQANYVQRWTLEDPLATPNGIGNPQLALQQLKQAVATTRRLYGSIDRPFGDASRFRIGAVDLPGRGGFGNLGVFDVITWDPPKDGVRLPQHGETWVAMVEFGTPLRAKGLMSYGNATQAGTPHNSDQLGLLSQGQFRTLWTTREEVEQHLESVDQF